MSDKISDSSNKPTEVVPSDVDIIEYLKQDIEVLLYTILIWQNQKYYCLLAELLWLVIYSPSNPTLRNIVEELHRFIESDLVHALNKKEAIEHHLAIVD